MDRHTPAQRSFNMSQVKSKNTRPELIMFKLLKERKIKFRRHYSILGKPDIVFLDCKLVVFIDGEFWHGKNFDALKSILPAFWVKKIGDNIQRDRRTARRLRKEGWHILHLWDKKVIKYPENSLKRIMRLRERLKSS